MTHAALIDRFAAAVAGIGLAVAAAGPRLDGLLCAALAAVAAALGRGADAQRALAVLLLQTGVAACARALTPSAALGLWLFPLAVLAVRAVDGPRLRALPAGFGVAAWLVSQLFSVEITAASGVAVISLHLLSVATALYATTWLALQPAARAG